MRAKAFRGKRSKYNAQRATGSDGFKYDSKGEMRRGESLRMDQEMGAIRMLLRQVPFFLPGGGKLVLDFVWMENDGTMHFEDFKSPVTLAKREFTTKRKLVEHHYDIEIEISGVRE